MGGIWGFPADLATPHSGWLGCAAIQLRRKPDGALRQEGQASGSQPLLAA
jgi:hypothetical protein